MTELLKFLLFNITGKTDFVIEETNQDDRIQLSILADSEYIGLIIGKGGNTIKAIQNILRIRGTIDNKYIYLTVGEKPSEN